MIINSAVVQIQTERKIGYNLVMRDLETLRETFTDDTELVSLETGECITMEEISRVLGIKNEICKQKINFVKKCKFICVCQK